MTDAPTPDPFGPNDSAQPKDERYNTRYLVANLKREGMRKKLFVLGLLLVATIVLIALFSTQSGKPPEKNPLLAKPADASSPAKP